MWFHRKDKATPPPVPTPPRSHHRTRATAPGIDPVVVDWLLAEADQLDAGALARETEADRLIALALEWRAVAAAKRALAVSVPTEAPPAAALEAAYDDPSQHNQTWRLLQPEAGPQEPLCGCQWWRGESCGQCDALVPARISVTAPWIPPADAHDTPVAALLANGDAR